jgi:HAD superfamily hydrolase (TIGR01509 family)
MIKAIIFDCFGVLTTDLWKEFVATLPPEQHAAARDLNYAYDSGRLSRDEFRAEVEKLTGQLPHEIETTIGSAVEKNHALLEYIEELTKKYKVSILSNIASDWVRSQFLTVEEQKLFNSMIFSHDVGMAKPDRAIFELAAERLAVRPEECVLIDDSPRHVAGAESVGMKGIIYENFEQMKHELEKALNA